MIYNKNINKMRMSQQRIYVFLLSLFLLSVGPVKADLIPKLSTQLIKLDHKPKAPSFNLPDMQDQQRSLNDYLGKPVIISFWGTWCPPCRAEIPYFNKAWDKLQNDDIEMLFININEGKETIEAFTQKYPIKLTILRDEGAGQLANWNMTGLPTTFIIDPEGRVVYQAMGERAWDNDDILDKVRALKVDATSVASVEK